MAILWRFLSFSRSLTTSGFTRHIISHSRFLSSCIINIVMWNNVDIWEWAGSDSRKKKGICKVQFGWKQKELQYKAGQKVWASLMHWHNRGRTQISERFLREKDASTLTALARKLFKDSLQIPDFTSWDFSLSQKNLYIIKSWVIKTGMSHFEPWEFDFPPTELVPTWLCDQSDTQQRVQQAEL